MDKRFAEIRDALEATGLRVNTIAPSWYGAIDDVFFIQTPMQSYVLKIYLHTPEAKIREEVACLKRLKSNGLKVAAPVRDTILQIGDKPGVLYECVDGIVPRIPGEAHILQIAGLLANIHKTPMPCVSLPFDLRIIPKSLPEFMQGRIPNLSTDSPTLIHGDMFPDNAHYDRGKLVGVFDFALFGIGNPLYDLGVVGISWCFDGDMPNISKLRALWRGYGRAGNGIRVTFSDVLYWSAIAGLVFASMRIEIGHKDPREMTRQVQMLCRIHPPLKTRLKNG